MALAIKLNSLVVANRESVGVLAKTGDGEDIYIDASDPETWAQIQAGALGAVEPFRVPIYRVRRDGVIKYVTDLDEEVSAP